MTAVNQKPSAIAQSVPNQSTADDMLVKIHRDPKLGEAPKTAQEQESSTLHNKFLTGIVCLRPVSETCISRLLDYFKDNPEASAPTTDEEEHETLHLLDSLHDFLRGWSALLGEGITSTPGMPLTPEAFHKKMGEFGEKGLRRYLERHPLPIPGKSESECEVKKDANGEIRVECTAP